MMTLVSGLLVSTQRKVSVQSQRSTTMLDHWFAIDLLMKDMRQASVPKKSWKKITATEIIWHQNNHDIGWCFEGHSLFRIEGTYNAGGQLWTKRTKNLVSDTIQKVAMCAQYDRSGQYIRGYTVDVSVLANDKPYTIHRVVALQGDGYYA